MIFFLRNNTFFLLLFLLFLGAMLFFWNTESMNVGPVTSFVAKALAALWLAWWWSPGFILTQEDLRAKDAPVKSVDISHAVQRVTAIVIVMIVAGIALYYASGYLADNEVPPVLQGLYDVIDDTF